VSSRLFVLEILVKYGRVSAYDLAKHAPFASSTIYYMLEKLRDEGYAEKAEGYYIPTFKAVLEYYKLKGCDGYLVKAVATMVGSRLVQYISQWELCAALHRVATAGVEAKTPAAAVMEYFNGKLDVKGLLSAGPEFRRFVALVFAGAGAEVDGDHLGILTGGVFVGFCRRCGLVATPCRDIRL
jgi:hypothetical protein